MPDWQDRRLAFGYQPDVPTNDLFCGNSNWRGPVWMPLNWMPLNWMQIEAPRIRSVYGDAFEIPHLTGGICTPDCRDSPMAVPGAGRGRSWAIR